jgi:hypothetical protein
MMFGHEDTGYSESVGATASHAPQEKAEIRTADPNDPGQFRNRSATEEHGCERSINNG